MNLLRRSFAALVMGLSMALASLGAQASITQLGFALDASGSISIPNYNLLRTGLSDALAGLPVDGTVEITIVSYGSGVATVTAPTILTAASLLIIQGQIAGHIKAGGGTNTAGAIDSLTALMVGSASFALGDTRSIINLATDGVPNSQAAAEASGAAALAAGIDALSIEAIGSGVSSAAALANMAAIAFPGPVTILPVNSVVIPSPLLGSWVVPVSDFDALAPVLAAKVQASVTQVPIPGTAALFAVAMLGMGVVAKRRASR